MTRFDEITRPPDSVIPLNYPVGSDYIPVGGSVRLISVRSLAREIGTSLRNARALLTSLQVPILVTGPGSEYFNLWSLELGLHAYLRPGRKLPPDGPKLRLASILVDVPDLIDETQLIARYYGHLDSRKLAERCRTLATSIRRCSTTEAAKECAQLRTRVRNMIMGNKRGSRRRRASSPLPWAEPPAEVKNA